jgi:hypothetical protein
MILLGTTVNCRNLIHSHGANLIFGAKQFEESVGNVPRALVMALDNNSGLCIWSDSFGDAVFD